MFVICFISQWMKRSKHGLFVFLPKKTLAWRRYFSIGQSCCSIVLGHEVFLHERSLNQQPKATRICIRSINQSNRSISVRLLFLFCSRVFISRSYKNHSILLSNRQSASNLVAQSVSQSKWLAKQINQLISKSIGQLVSK